MGVKAAVVGPNWCALLAGSYARSYKFASTMGRYLGSHNVSDQILTEALREPWRDFRRSLMEDETSKRGIPLDDYLYSDTLNEHVRSDLSVALQKIPNDYFVLMSGFVGGKPVIVRADSESLCVVNSFAAIGTGEFLATTLLNERQYTSGVSLAEALYLVYEAKRFSEKAEGVNRRTNMYVQFSHPRENTADSPRWAHIQIVSETGLDELGKMFRQYGLQRTDDLDKVKLPDFFWEDLSQQPKQEFVDRPDVIGDPSSHSGSDS